MCCLETRSKKLSKDTFFWTGGRRVRFFSYLTQMRVGGFIWKLNTIWWSQNDLSPSAATLLCVAGSLCIPLVLKNTTSKLPSLPLVTKNLLLVLYSQQIFLKFHFFSNFFFRCFFRNAKRYDCSGPCVHARCGHTDLCSNNDDDR